MAHERMVTRGFPKNVTDSTFNLNPHDPRNPFLDIASV